MLPAPARSDGLVSSGSGTDKADAAEWLRLIGPLACLLFVAVELAAYEQAFGHELWRLRVAGVEWRLWGYLGVAPKSLALLAAGAAFVIAARIGAHWGALLGPNQNRSRASVLHGAAGALLITTTLLVTGTTLGLPSAANAALPWLVPIALPLWAISALLVLAPGTGWARVLRDCGWEVLFVLLATAAYKLAVVAFPDIEKAIAAVLFGPTTYIAGSLDALMGYAVSTDAAARTMTVGALTETIAPSCLGYVGVGLIALFLTAYIYLARRQLRFPNVLAVIPAALGTILLFNGVRIALLMAIGASWSPAIARQGFHSAAGWVSLLVVALAAVVLINKLAIFSKRPARTATALSDEDIQLIPQLVLLAVAMGTLLFTASFDWLYPVRVAAVGAVLLWYRQRLHLGSLWPRLAPMTIGFVVFLFWIALVPAEPDKAAEFSTALFSAPAWGVAGWMLIRIIGAVIVVPVAEELAFRGFLLTRLEAGFTGLTSPGRQIAATLVSSVAFGALHGSWLAGTLAGIAFAGARYSRGRLSDAICAHAVANLMLAIYVLLGGNWSYW